MPFSSAGVSSTDVTPDTILEALTDPLTPTFALLASLADLLGLPSLTPSLNAPSRPSARARTVATSKPICAPLSDLERTKLSMRIVNSSLAALSSFVQAKWSPPLLPPPPPASKSTVGRSTRSEPVSSTLKGSVRGDSSQKEDGRADSTPSLENVQAVLGCAQLALRQLRMRPGKEEEPDVVVEKAGVTVVARCNALGLYDRALSLLHDSHSSILRLNGQLPLPSSRPPGTDPHASATSATARKVHAEPTPSKITPTSRPVRAKTSSSSSTTPSAAASSVSRTTSVRTASTKPSTAPASALRPSAHDTTPRQSSRPTDISLLSHLKRSSNSDEPISDPTLASVFLTWALSATLAIIMSTHTSSSASELPSSAETLLASLETPSCPFQTFPPASLSKIPSSTQPALLLPLIRALFSPPNLSSSSSDPIPSLLLRYRLLSLSLLIHLPGLQPSMLWDQVLRAVTSYLRVGGHEGHLSDLDYARVTAGLTQIMKEVGQRKDGGKLMRGKEWAKVTELWGKVAGKTDDLETLALISRLLSSTPDTTSISSTASANDLVAKLDNLTLAPSAPSSSLPSPSTTATVDPSLVLARASAVFSQAFALSSNHSSSPSPSSAALLASQLEQASSSLSELRNVAAVVMGIDGEDEILGKMSRAMEKLRRACLAVIESKGGDDEQDQQTREQEGGLKRLPEKAMLLLVEVVEGVIRSRTEESTVTSSLLSVFIDLTTSSVDSLLVLSRKTFSPNRSTTYASSFGLLTRANDLRTSLQAIPIPSSASATEAGPILTSRREIANLARCISGTAYNSGGTLYRTGREVDGPGGEAVVRFFRMACELGRDAVGEYGAAMKSDAGKGNEKDKDAWDGLKDGMSKRWELLGGCLIKSGKKQEGYEAFLTALASTPPSVLSRIAKLSFSTPISDFLSLPSDSPETTAPPPAQTFFNLTSLIGRLTNLSLTLSRSPSSLASGLSTALRLVAKEDDVDDWAAAIGALLEFQVGVLGRLRGREGVQEMTDGVLRETLACYRVDRYPVRRLRTLALRIQQIAYLSETEGGETPNEDLVSEVSLFSEIKDVGLDVELALYRSQHLGTCHLWLAFHAYISSQQQPPPSPSSESTVVAQQPSQLLYHSDRALAAIGELVLESRSSDGFVPPQVTKDKVSKAPPVGPTKTPAPTVERTRRTPARASKTAAPATAPVVKVRTTKTPKSTVKATPLAQKIAEPMLAATPPSTKTKIPHQAAVFDDLNGFLSNLEMMSNLLGLLGYAPQRIDYLRLIRRISNNRSAQADIHVRVSGQLATEYLKISKVSLARSIFSSTNALVSKLVLEGGDISFATRADFSLRHAQYLANQGRLDAAVTSYQEALKTSKEIVIVGSSSSSARIRERCSKLERAAFALFVAADIHKAKNDFAAVFASLTQSHRLWTRAADNISRLSQSSSSVKPLASPSEPKTNGLVNPFEVAKPAGQDPAAQPSADEVATKVIKKPLFFGIQLNGTQWRVSEGLLECLFALASSALNRGTSRDTEYYLQQAFELAQSVGSTVLVARSLGRKAALFMQTGKLKEAVGVTDEALEALGSIVGRDAAELASIRGQQYLKFGNFDEAFNVLAAGTQSLRAIDAGCSSQDLRLSTSNRRRSSTSGGHDHACLPLLAFLLRLQAATIKHVEDHDPAVLQALQDEIARLPLTSETLSLVHHHDAKLGLIRVLEEFEADLSLSSLTESTISMPMGSATGGSAAVAKSRTAFKSLLARVEAAFNKSLETNEALGAVQRVREASVSLSRIRSFATSLGYNDPALTLKAARLLDASSAITLRRELMEIIESKFREPARDDLEWYEFEPSEQKPRVKRMAIDSGSDEDDSDDEDVPEDPSRVYWRTLQEQHLLPSSLVVSPVSALPHNWTVITINVAEDLNTLFVSRHRHDSDPLVFCLPLERQARRDGDAEGQLTFAEAISELADIIAKSNLGAKNAKDVEGKEGKIAWWAERRELDKRMEDLLSNIEFCWLGAFKTIFNVPSLPASASLPLFRTKIEKLFKNALSPTKERKKLPRVRLDESLLECFSTLSSECRDEELEDLVYFVLDLYQVHGVPVALAELDIDQLATDLRDILVDLESPRLSSPSNPSDAEEPHHTFLILDRHVQPIPWESLPSLRGRSICRIPSLAFLTDRVLLSQLLQPSTRALTPPRPPSLTSTLERPPSENAARTALMQLDGTKGFYVLNPSGDLKKTQERFEPWVERMQRAGWTGISGRVPSEVELLKALETKDIVVYFGHGGAEQYVRSHRIRNLPRCASLMLWGCSSGVLREMGELDRSGTPWNYMLAGCPSLVANLWDVTDRDIDRLSEAVLESMHLGGHEQQQQQDGSTKKPDVAKSRKRSTAEAVGEARSKCKLKYLTGAAPVVYGVPVGLVEQSTI